jgi:hypothetical protein
MLRECKHCRCQLTVRDLARKKNPLELRPSGSKRVSRASGSDATRVRNAATTICLSMCCIYRAKATTIFPAGAKAWRPPCGTCTSKSKSNWWTALDRFDDCAVCLGQFVFPGIQKLPARWLLYREYNKNRFPFHLATPQVWP